MIDAAMSISMQVDRLNLYLAGYDKVPVEIKRLPNVFVYRSQDYPDTAGDGHKFHKVPKEGYYFSCDDDLIYPPGYVEYFRAKIDHYGREAIVGLHGVLIKPGATHYYRDRTLYHGLQDLNTDIQVHVIGTCSCAFHTSAIDIGLHSFRSPNIADIWLAEEAQKQDVPIMCIAHRKGWVTHTTKIDMGQTLHSAFHKSLEYPGNPIIQARKWRLPQLKALI